MIYLVNHHQATLPHWPDAVVCGSDARTRNPPTGMSHRPRQSSRLRLSPPPITPSRPRPRPRTPTQSPPGSPHFLYRAHPNWAPLDPIY
jgi:hypothetical protein